MDAFSRMVLAREAPFLTVWHNPNVTRGTKPKKELRRPATAPASPDLDAPHRPPMKKPNERRKCTAAGEAVMAAKLENRRLLPGPGHYKPRLTQSGAELEMRDLNGAELMQMSSFAGTLPARGPPQEWDLSSSCPNLVVVNGAARVRLDRSLHTSSPSQTYTPSPQKYTPKSASLSTLRAVTVPKMVRLDSTRPSSTPSRRRERTVGGPIMVKANERRRITACAIDLGEREVASRMPGPGYYQPRVTTTGWESEMRELNGAELMQMSAFAGQTPARSPPEDWGTVAMRSVRRDDAQKPQHSWPAPHDYSPLYKSVMASYTAPRMVRSSTVSKARKSVTPGPGQYQPRVTATGRESEMRELNGAELMQMSAFAGQTPARATPLDWDKQVWHDDWGTTAIRSVARADRRRPEHQWPAPHDYAPEHRALSTSPVAHTPKIAPESPEALGLVVPRIPKVSPGPAEYRVKLTSTGRESDLADLNGTERMPSAAFTSTAPARSSPRHWATPSYLGSGVGQGAGVPPCPA